MKDKKGIVVFLKKMNVAFEYDLVTLFKSCAHWWVSPDKKANNMAILLEGEHYFHLVITFSLSTATFGSASRIFVGIVPIPTR